MGIIEFLMKNFYVVLLVLFLLSRMMKSAGRKPAGMPTFGGDGSDTTGGSHHEGPFEERSERAERGQQADGNEEQGVYRSKLETMTREDNRSYGNSGPIARPSFSSLGGMQSPRRQQVNQITAPKAGLSRNELRKAILWSEVLGPPRAKRSYRK